MKKKIIIGLALLLPVVLMAAAVIGYQDWQLRGSAPGNPASGFVRTWADNTASAFLGLTSAGAPFYWSTNFAGAYNTGILPIANGGTNTATPGLIAGTNITSITGTWPNQTINAATQTATVTHAPGATFDGGGSALTIGTKVYEKLKYACTVQSWGITVDTGTITIDIWKTANGAGIPTIANTITASATPAIASGTDVSSTTMTGWTRSISLNDNIGFDITAVSGATKASLTLQCQ